jgi:dienelactone hydrolase
LALLFPFHCRAKGYEDVDVDPSEGIGRALFAALSQLSQSSGHQELVSANLILLGFSGTGSLVARLAGYAPDRVIASIPTDPPQFDPLGIDTLSLSPEAMRVPQLILTGSTDHVSGTKRPHEYFRKYFDGGAPWAFVIQNKTPHCCIINAKKLILLWIEAMLEERQRSNGVLRPVATKSGWSAFIVTRETETKDDWGEKTWEVSDAKIQRSGSTPPEGMISAGWLPNHRVAKEWRSFVKHKEHPLTSLP